MQSRIDFIGRRDPDAALSQSRRVETAVGRLAIHPLLGRSGRRPGTRELVASGTAFPIVHRVEGEVITVLRLFHGARDWPTMP